MNDNERKIYEKYEKQGYDVIHTGVPDLILLKDGEIQFVEIKNAADLLRKSQMRSIALLRKHGFKARVERIPTVQKSALLAEWTKTNLAKPHHINPVQTTPGQTIPNHPRPGQIIPIQPRPNHANPNHSRPLQARPPQSQPNQAIPPHAKPIQPMSGQTRPLQTRPIHFKGGEI